MTMPGGTPKGGDPGIFGVHQAQAALGVQPAEAGKLRIDGLSGQRFGGDGEPAFRGNVLYWQKKTFRARYKCPMPTYGYECLSCDNQFEIFQSIKDDALTTCDKCGGTLRKRIYPVGISFKGSGFYVNDYAAKPSGGESGES